MDTSQYLDIFIDETKEHLQSLNEHILILEKEPENEDTINEIFRAAHSLKGMAGTMGYKRMQTLTHDMESVFQEIRGGNMKVQAKLIDILFRGLDALEGYLANIQAEANEGTDDHQDIIDDLNALLNEKQKPAESAKKEETKKEPQATGAKYMNIEVKDFEIRAMDSAKAEGKNVFGITVYLQETCILKAARAFLVFKTIENKGELVKSVPSVEDIEDEEFEFDFSWILVTSETKDKVKKMIENVSEIKEVFIDDFSYQAAPVVQAEEASSQGAATTTETDKKQQPQKAPSKATKVVASRSVRVDIDKLDVLMNLVSELIIAKNGLVSATDASGTISRNSAVGEQIEYIERVTTNLHESVMRVRMVPIESVVNRFPRMIRDISRKLDKKMELYMTGEETELDRTVIDEIGEPLMHLLRNSADHGLESNEERVRLGKPEVGSVFLDAYQIGNNVVIEVRDDGAGINVEKVKNKALEKGTITQVQAETMSDKEIIGLLFKPSFSTAEKVSDISGRGVGLDVVKTKIEALGGTIDCKTELGVGSTFSIQLPLTLAIIQTLLVKVAEGKYAIPISNISTIEELPASDVKLVQGKEVINLRGTVIPIIRLRDMFDEEKEEDPENITVVVIKKGEKLAGLVIDYLYGQQETVIKTLGTHLKFDKLFSGATILGNGDVALIVDANSLI